MAAPTHRKEFQKGFKPPFQTQANVPGSQFKLDPPPIDDVTADGKPYKAAGKLQGRTALITGADSGIGRAVAILFGSLLSEREKSAVCSSRYYAGLEGASMTLAFTPDEEPEARQVEQILRDRAPTSKVQMVAVDLRTESACKKLIEQVTVD
jgi:hypothetical protein